MFSDQGKNAVPQGMVFKGRDGKEYFLLGRSIYCGNKTIVRNGKLTGVKV